MSAGWAPVIASPGSAASTAGAAATSPSASADKAGTTFEASFGATFGARRERRLLPGEPSGQAGTSAHGRGDEQYIWGGA